MQRLFLSVKRFEKIVASGTFLPCLQTLSRLLLHLFPPIAPCEVDVLGTNDLLQGDRAIGSVMVFCFISFPPPLSLVHSHQR